MGVINELIARGPHLVQDLISFLYIPPSFPVSVLDFHPATRTPGELRAAGRLPMRCQPETV